MDRTMAEIRREFVEKYGPEPQTVLEQIDHTLKVYADEADDWMVLLADSGKYGEGVATGIRMDTLRALRGALGRVAAELDAAETTASKDAVELVSRLRRAIDLDGGSGD